MVVSQKDALAVRSLDMYVSFRDWLIQAPGGPRRWWARLL